MKHSILTISVAALVLSLDASAALIERDWTAPGDAALTYDTDTGLEWLDLTKTAGLSYNDVIPQLVPGNIFQSFAYASTQQIIDLFSAVDLEEFDNAKTTEGPKISLLLSFWGVLWNFNPGERSEFVTANTDGLPAGEHWTGRVFWLSTLDTGVAANGDTRADTSNSFTIGSALVRQATTVTLNGDVNEDGKTDTADLLLIQQVVMGSPVTAGIEPGHADLHPISAPDGIINISDLILMYQLVLAGS